MKQHIITGIAAAVLGGGLCLLLESRRTRPAALPATAPTALSLPPPAETPKATVTNFAKPAPAGGQGLWAGVPAETSAKPAAQQQRVTLPPPAPAPTPATLMEPDGAALWGRATPGERAERMQKPAPMPPRPPPATGLDSGEFRQVARTTRDDVPVYTPPNPYALETA